MKTLLETFQNACAQGKLNVLKQFAKHPSFDRLVSLFDGFALACQYGQLDVLKFFVANCAYIRKSSLRLGLSYACINCDLNILKFMLTLPNVNLSENDNFELALNKACFSYSRKRVKTSFIKFLCELGDLNLPTILGKQIRKARIGIQRIQKFPPYHNDVDRYHIAHYYRIIRLLKSVLAHKQGYEPKHLQKTLWRMGIRNVLLNHIYQYVCL